MKSSESMVTKQDHQAVIDYARNGGTDILSDAFARSGIEMKRFNFSVFEAIDNNTKRKWQGIMTIPGGVNLKTAKDFCLMTALEVILTCGRYTLDSGSDLYFAPRLHDKLQEVLGRIADRMPDPIDKRGFGSSR